MLQAASRKPKLIDIKLGRHGRLPSRPSWIQLRRLLDQGPTLEDHPRRGKQLKEDFKLRHKEIQQQKRRPISSEQQSKLSRWDLNIGLEIHAQLNTERKLFSESKTSINDDPNSNVNFYDLAFPGSQPIFQPATVLPAIRAAIALNCRINSESTFDRKHYFYPDQPAGYQITQYYRPLAVDGYLELNAFDDEEFSGKPVKIGIKQIQLEQDTAKSVSQPPSTTLIDFNRVGHPLIEIITLPHLQSAQAAAACAKKILSFLQAVNAVNAGMEMGGLRADVNVSVSPKGSQTLGQRTEIKNVSSFKAIEQAIVAERDRQIDILEGGGSVLGETRGWTLGDTQTTRLRGKEGEVDYRYMPDPDVPSLLIDQNLVGYLKQSLPPLPDEVAGELVTENGLSPKDARTLVFLDEGQRLEYYDEVCAAWAKMETGLTRDQTKVAANWIIHEFGRVLSSSPQSFSFDLIRAEDFAQILSKLHRNVITGSSAKRLLSIVFDGHEKGIEEIIHKENMEIKHLSNQQYLDMAQDVIERNPNQVQAIKNGQLGKIKFLVGQIMRTSSGTAEASRAESAIHEVLQRSANSE